MIHEAILAKFENAGVPNAQAAASQFMATGFLITVSEVLDLPQMLWYKQNDENQNCE